MNNQQITSLVNHDINPDLENSILQKYLLEIGQYAVLSNEELTSVAMRYAEHQDPEDGHLLIVTNLRLVVKIAFKYQPQWGSNFMDLIQEGNAGLVKAIEKYDPYRQVNFSTYASYWIRAKILNYMMSNKRLVKINTTQTMRRMYFSYNKKKQQLEMQTGNVDDESLAEALQITKEKLYEIDERLNGSEMSLATPISNDSNSELQDIIKNSGSSFTDEVELKDIQTKVQNILEKERKRLNPREHLILDERLLTDSPVSLAHIGNRLNISRERVRQLEFKLKEKLRKMFLKASMDESSIYSTG